MLSCGKDLQSEFVEKKATRVMVLAFVALRATLQVSLLVEAFPKVGWVKEVMIGTMDVKSGCF